MSLSGYALQGLGIFAVLMLAVGYCSSQKDDPDKSEANYLSDATQYSSAPAAEPYNAWQYDSSQDEISGRTVHQARLTSLNAHNFDFPYQGDTYLTVTVQHHPRYGRDLYFTIDRGQILCHPGDDCHGTISVDGRVERLSLTEPDDNSSDVVFATYDEAIRRKIAKANTFVVELPIFQEGNPAWTFKPGNALIQSLSPKDAPSPSTSE